jgi:type IV pilus assembly protein PilF
MTWADRRVWGRADEAKRPLQVLAGLLMLASVLHGCAGGGAGSSATGPIGSSIEPLTASDEPENRKRARIRMELATGYFEQGQTTVALDELKQVLVIDPNYPDAYNLRGLIYMRLADFRLADESFRKALAINPRDPNTLHNYGWMQCQQGRFADANALFRQALASPLYGGQGKTWMAQGLCQMRAGQREEAERSLAHAYEIDAGNPITGYNLAALLYQRGDFARAQFYIRRLNNSELANSETLWLGVRVERRMQNMEAMQQLSDQLRKRYPGSREVASLERGAFDE